MVPGVHVRPQVPGLGVIGHVLAELLPAVEVTRTLMSSGGNHDDEEQQGKKEQNLQSDHLLTLPFPARPRHILVFSSPAGIRRMSSTGTSCWTIAGSAISSPAESSA